MMIKQVIQNTRQANTKRNKVNILVLNYEKWYPRIKCLPEDFM